MSTNNLDNKLISFNKKITSNKTKYLEVQKKLDSLTTKCCNVFSGRMYFTIDDASQNMFVYTLELKKTSVLIMFLVGNQRQYILLNLSHYTLLSYIA